MAVARYLVQGCDVWLNTPLRPQEASGTSGMKALANGVINLSTLDGWWDEAWRMGGSGETGVGWAIGSGESYKDAASKIKWRRPPCTNGWSVRLSPLSTNDGRMGCRENGLRL